MRGNEPAPFGKDGLKEAHRKAIIDILSAHPGVERIVLFGSRAMGTFTIASDVDIALFGGTLTLEDQAKLTEKLDELPFPQRVDLVLADRVESPELLEHIRKHGVEWCHDSDKNLHNASEPCEWRGCESRLQKRQGSMISAGSIWEVSAVADEWQNGILGDCLYFQSGGTPSKSRPDFWDGDIPWVSAKDMKSFLINDSEDHLTDMGAAQAPHLAEAGTTLILVRGMTLHNDVPICRIRCSCAFNQDVKAAIARLGTDTVFVPYLFLGNKQRLLSMVDSAGHGTGRLNMDTLLNLPISIPPLKEQQAIAAVLGALDDKIDLNRRMCRTLESMAKALFKSWFVDFDPVRAKAEGRQPQGMKSEIADLFPSGFQDSEFGEIPEGWSAVSLTEAGNFLNGLVMQKYPPLDDEFLPVIKIAQLHKGNTEGTDRASIYVDPVYVVNDGDVLFSWSGSLDCVIWSGGRGVLNQHIFKVTSDIFGKWFMYLWVDSYLPIFREIAASKATTMGHIQRHHLASAIAIYAPKPIMGYLGKTINVLFDSVLAKSLQCRQLSALRDTLLPKLISGELRVPDAERIVARAL
jgi:type I restriction enzyme S subunit